MKPIVLALLATIVISALGFTGTAYAQESGASDAAGMKLPRPLRPRSPSVSVYGSLFCP